MKKTNNKGFSLVELIIVIAIMAVLIGVLAPQFMRYVERTRLQRDNSAIAEIANALEVSLANENIYNGVTFPVSLTIAGAANTNATVTFTGGITNDTATNDVATELNNVIGATYTTSSNTYRTPATSIVISSRVDANGNVITEITGDIQNVGGAVRTAHRVGQ